MPPRAWAQGGYSPITDVALLAGARLLTKQRLVLEIGRATELLKALQKRDPSFVRFTVDRMGTLAYVKFAKPAPARGGVAVPFSRTEPLL